MEIELKLALDARHAARLRKHPRLAGLSSQRRKLNSVYLDTPDFQLLARRLAFRLRRVGFHWVQTLKAEARAVGALSSRPEWEMAVAGGGPDFAVLPEAALDRLKGIDLAAIRPVFVTEFQRTTWLIQAGESVMELALDRGEIRAGQGDAPARQALSEIEIELKSGPPAALFDLARDLLDAVPLGVEPRSKAERGYHLAGALNPAPVNALDPGLAPDQPAGEAWVRIARAALAQAVANVPGFLAQPEDVAQPDDIEYLHQLRVALRRLRASVGLAASLGLARPAWAEPLAALMLRLNPARDWDVFRHETLPALERRLADEPLEAALLDRIRAAAVAARQTARQALIGADFTRLVLDLGQALLTPPAAELDAGAWAQRVLDRRWKRLRRLGRHFDAHSPDQRHQLRIAAKKLRYAADALAGVFDADARPFLKRLSRLQNDLGRFNDVVMAHRLLADLGVRQTRLSYDLGRIHGLLLGHADVHDRASARVWQELLHGKRIWR